MRICSFPLDDAAIQTIHPKDVYLIKMADEQSMELFVMQEDLLTPHEPVFMEENQTGVLHLQKHKQ